jgi:hypothetical protein
MMGVFDRLFAPFTVLARLTILEGRMNDFDTSLARIDAATTEVANDLRELREQLANGVAVTPEQLAALAAAADRLEGIGADPTNPVPDVPSEPEPA